MESFDDAGGAGRDMMAERVDEGGRDESAAEWCCNESGHGSLLLHGGSDGEWIAGDDGPKAIPDVSSEQLSASAWDPRIADRPELLLTAVRAFGWLLTLVEGIFV